MIGRLLRTHVRRSGLLFAAAACVALSWSGLAAAAAAPAPWAPVTLPSGGAWVVNDAWTFGSASLAVCGEEGHIAVSRDAGESWTDVVPTGFEAATFTAIALDGSGYGAAASGTQLLVTRDGGVTWRVPDFIDAAPQAPINDVALRNSRIVAVGDEGTILWSGDAGATWTQALSPTESALTVVAVTWDGTAVAGSATGEILVGNGEGWRVVARAAGPVTSVATTAAPLWGDGQTDLVAVAGREVLGSDDGATFAPLPGVPASTSQPWSAVAWTGAPELSLLLAGSGQAGFFGPAGGTWVSGPSGLSSAALALAPGGQSVAYLLSGDGLISRTLSAGRQPATARLSATRIVVGTSTRLSARVRIAAPGDLLVQSRVPGRPWQTEQTIAWTPADWDATRSWSFTPSLTHEYALAFRYGGTVVPLTPVTKVVVTPKVKPARTRYDLRRGDVFRFSGTVSPRLSGERVQLFTDRGGKWRPISLQESVALTNDGRSWTSRRFGTPKAETYRLRAYVAATKAHAGAWSRIVTVSIR